MLLHWYVIISSVIAEYLLCLVLVFPSSPLALKKQIIALANDAVVKRVAKIFAFIVSVLCAESLLAFTYATEPTETNKDREAFHHFSFDMLTNRYNALLSGISVLLLLILYEFVRLVKENIRMTCDVEVLKKQAQSASTGYLQLLDEKKKPSTESPKVENDQQSTERKLQQKNKEMQDENEQLNKKLEKALQEVQAVKKQASNQQDAYLKLLDENKSLKNKLDDFNVVFGETQKKTV